MSPEGNGTDVMPGGADRAGGDRVHDEAAELRQRAEARLAESSEADLPKLDGLSPDQMREALHELKVHQIELEMQNEELRRSRAEVEASHERYFDLFDLAPMGYFTLTEDGLILEANLTGSDLLGVARSDLVDRPFTQSILPEDQDLYYRHRRAVVNAGAPARCELRMVRNDGSIVHALLESAPSIMSDNRATYRTAVSDITERTRAAAQQLLLEQRLQQVEKAESLGRMAGSMAHHFNNLLSIIIGNLELVLDEPTDDPGRDWPDLVEYLSDALAGALKASDLTRLLQTYLGHATSEPSVLDLSEVIRRGIPLLQIAMPLATELEVDLPSPGPAVRMDPRDIQQLLTNLVTNAWEASEPEGATVFVTVSTVRAHEIPERDRFPAEWQANASSYARLQVRDEGRGIEAERLKDIFDPFFTSKSFGRGLGLPVALGTVKAHGGAVTVTTLPGHGTSFIVYLPVAETSTADPAEGGSTSPFGTQVTSEDTDRGDALHPSQETRAGRDTVLVVEDDPNVRRLTKSVLGRMGFQVVEAADGVEALKVFKEHRGRIRAVLCDVLMPRMGGWDTLEALRRIDPVIPVVLISGFDEAGAEEGRPDRPDAFLGKPWQIQQLRDVLGQVLQGWDGGQTRERAE